MIRVSREISVQLCHAATLALVGWYLMGPPVISVHFESSDFADPDAPLSKWTILKSFDAAKDCEAGRQNMLREHKNKHDEVVYDDAVCIVTDDPRLTGK